jgi:predicted secreted hydrolase
VRRRAFLGMPLLVVTPPAFCSSYPPVVRGRPLAFPRDHGSHPEFRNEWWYVTGIVRDAVGRELGVQVTFFRNRPDIAEAGASRFAPRQLMFAHAAIADPAHGRLHHDQRAERAAFDLAGADESTTRAWLRDWSLALDGDTYVARIAARDFALDLRFRATQSVLVQGDGGYSRKGPLPTQASYYYSWPQLQVSGRIAVDGRTREVSGRAWLDHEWSSEVMAQEAVGWDWIGVNLDDGGAVMAFRMRDRNDGAVWGGGGRRSSTGATEYFLPEAVRFSPRRTWTSPRTSITYPVEVDVRAGSIDYAVTPIMDDQELDSRASTGTVYWEGAVRVTQAGRLAGRGYLELTGYGGPLRI